MESLNLSNLSKKYNKILLKEQNLEFSENFLLSSSRNFQDKYTQKFLIQKFKDNGAFSPISDFSKNYQEKSLQKYKKKNNENFSNDFSQTLTEMNKKRPSASNKKFGNDKIGELYTFVSDFNKKRKQSIDLLINHKKTKSEIYFKNLSIKLEEEKKQRILQKRKNSIKQIKILDKLENSVEEKVPNFLLQNKTENFGNEILEIVQNRKKFIENSFKNFNNFKDFISIQNDR